MNEIALRDATPSVDSWVPMLPAVGDLAAKIANTSFVPKGLRGKPAEIAACILTGRELGIGPMESLAKIDIIEGTPAINAELMRSLVLKAGHEMRFTALTDQKVTVEGRRAGSDDWTAVTWSMADAQRAGLSGKSNWTKHPRQMLSARATAELCRLLFADALGGISHLPDEIEPVESTPVRRATQRVSRKAPELVEPPLEDAVAPEPEIVDAEVVEETPADEPEPTVPAATQAQVQKLAILLGERGVDDRDARLAFISDRVGRPIASSKDLDRAEASALINALEQGEGTA